jgi:hypothetical protein
LVIFLIKVLVIFKLNLVMVKLFIKSQNLVMHH